MTIVDIVLISLLALCFIGGIYARKKEIKEFNKGSCQCGGKFKTFDMDSQGGTGWKCQKCNKYMWTSWIRSEEYDV